MDNFTGDKVHFEPMSEPSEGPYTIKTYDNAHHIFGPSRSFGTEYVEHKWKMFNWCDKNLAENYCYELNLVYLEGRQSMQAELDDAKIGWTAEINRAVEDRRRRGDQ